MANKKTYITLWKLLTEHPEREFMGTGVLDEQNKYESKWRISINGTYKEVYVILTSK